ncbi:hypothetical protein [Archangium sp.]|uniref:hypothetical protein n=1 Tax=Archangium sp. TaxID=1872627 RepID=UPI002D445415|nr:hypothetical protein [Archangium sp.]HYO57211.1 hypothetical protein [Archangium sp.]
MSRLLSLILMLVSIQALGQPITSGALDRFNQSRVNILAIVDSAVSQRELVSRLAATLATKSTTQQQLEQQQALQVNLLIPPPGFAPPSGATIDSVSARIEELKKVLTDIQQVEAKYRDVIAQELILCSALRGEFKVFEDGLTELISELSKARSSPATLSALRQDDVFQANRVELNKTIYTVKNAQTKFTAMTPSCQLTPVPFDRYFEQIDNFTSTILNQTALANQANTLWRISEQLEVLNDLEKAQSLYIDTVQTYNDMVDAISQASVAGVLFTLKQAEESQLIKSPEQSWERPADFMVWGGTLLSTVSLGVGYFQSKNPPESSSQKALPWLGAGVGALAALAGQVFKNQSLVPDAARKVADRAATNRLVGLEIQAMMSKVEEAQKKFEASDVPPRLTQSQFDLTRLHDAQSVFEAAVKTAIQQVSPLPGSTVAPVLVNASSIRSQYEGWSKETSATLNGFDQAFLLVQQDLPKVKQRVQLLKDVLGATSVAVGTLRNLLGNSIDTQCTTHRTVVCKTPGATQQITTEAFCNKKPTLGNKHFATELLSDQGKETLLELGACSMALSQQAAEKSTLALTKFDMVESKTAEWKNEIGPAHIRIHVEKVDTAMAAAIAGL